MPLAEIYAINILVERYTKNKKEKKNRKRTANGKETLSAIFFLSFLFFAKSSMVTHSILLDIFMP